MTSGTDGVDEETQTTLPPLISNNFHEKLEPEKIPIIEIAPTVKILESFHLCQVPSKVSVDARTVVLPLKLIWSPEKLLFEIESDKVVKKLWVWNGCMRSIYLHCCGMWDDTARLGASWRCYPRTRFLLAPGLVAEIFVQATPRPRSPVWNARASLQLAASYLRDISTAYYEVPLLVEFRNVLAPFNGEDG